MVRERLTGWRRRKCRHVVDLWRPWIEEKAAGQLDQLIDAIHDQTAFASASRDIIACPRHGR